MTTTERLSFASIRNRAEQHQLCMELNRIEREKRNELRMLNTERLKFRSKYSKLSPVDPNEANQVRMYETHTPGFCYKRNGEQKNVQQVQPNPSIDFKHIHHLIFTDGEVDINKILCLHLISSHRTETLTPPKKKMKYVCRDHSPTERLIDRSKKGYTSFEKLSSLLPMYTLEIIEHGAMGENTITLINDGRLAARILVNEKVRELLNTVVSALEQSNNEKLKKLVEIANNTSLLKQVLGKRDTIEFLERLFDHSLINSCESFTLTPPFKIKTRDLDIRTLSGSLEHLIRHIRQNVLQISSQNVWSRLRQEEVYDRILQSKISSASLPKIKMERKQTSDTTSSTSRSSKSARNEVPMKLPSRRTPVEEGRSSRSSTNYIARNIEAAAKVKRIEYDVDEEEEVPSKRPSISPTRSKRRSQEPPVPMKQIFLPPVVEIIAEKVSAEEAKTENVEGETPGDSTSLDSQAKASKKKSVDSHESKYHIKQTTCPACMEKWKTPLPTPKTPRVKTSSVLPGSESSLLKTNSQHRISMLISKEMYKLQSYDRKYSIENESPKRAVTRKKEVDTDRLEAVELNPMDLAKIEQEIKEKETQKKLEKFLKEIV